MRLLLFVIFHSYYPNKQERFILPVIPFFIIAGTAGWMHFREKSRFWLNSKWVGSLSWGFFWVINIAALLVITTTYSKRARVESMTYLSRYTDIGIILVENSNKSSINLLPMYYLGQWVGYGEITNSRNAAEAYRTFEENDLDMPDFIIFEGENNIESRTSETLKFFPGYEFETTISPGLIDRILFWLNPVNENQNAYIYRNTNVYPHKIE